ncbi:predicted protein [Botrytis cinerea T4]|uniref:Uncharacterized protein n=1 Tax=Botryotinia fuckeliana (strain T4) TaxID=999810 RepID=G2YJ54_BOTF4|nr:predicted protein [Botrytis cinerea T4]
MTMLTRKDSSANTYDLVLGLTQDFHLKNSKGASNSDDWVAIGVFLRFMQLQLHLSLFKQSQVENETCNKLLSTLGYRRV